MRVHTASPVFEGCGKALAETLRRDPAAMENAAQRDFGDTSSLSGSSASGGAVGTR